MTEPASGAEAPQPPFDRAVRVVLERGVEVRRTREDTWHATSSDASIDPRRLNEHHRLRPVLAEYPLAPELTHTALLPIQGLALNVEYSELSRMRLAEGLFQDHMNICYVLGAALYHCRRLAEVYGMTVRESIRGFRPDDSVKRAVLGDVMEPYHEFDALMAATRRFYETSRSLLWSVFPGGGSRPRNFEGTMERCGDRLPGGLRRRLEESWRRTGVPAREYRDCLLHYVPLHKGMPHAQVIQLEPGLWALWVPIPSNPEAQSQKKFVYREELDALMFGWETTCEVFAMARELIEGVLQARPPA